jgi:hypothetical protein
MKKKADTQDEVVDSRFLRTVYYLLSSLHSLSRDDPRHSHSQTPHSVQVALTGHKLIRVDTDGSASRASPS